VWDAGPLVRGSEVRFLRARNQQGYDIYLYLLPYADQCNAGYILIDLDHATPDVVPLMRANGHEPCVVLQSSYLGLGKDAPERRGIMRQGEIIGIPQVGGLHHRYERRVA